MPIKSDLDEFANVFPSTNPGLPARRLMILHRTQQSTLFDIRMRLASLSCITGLLTQHAFRALNVHSVSSADAEAERALNGCTP